MSKPLDGQTVLVTGGGRGLGAAIVRAFAREGSRVAINYFRSADKAEALAEELGERSFAVQGDVRSKDSIRAMLDRVGDHFGAPTTLVHNAIADYSFNGDARDSLSTLSTDSLDAQFHTAVHGALNLTQAVAPAMADAGFGRIVHIGTNLMQNPVVPYHDYVAAKGALLALTRTSAAELGPQGISVNMVSGGLLRTTDASAATPDAVFDFIAEGTPLRSVTTPEEAADAVLFFASPWARAVTGQNLIVDGGLVYG
ncbi:MAG: 3-oxoacyl-ACP reductase [Acidobacteriota bacterium]